MKSYYTLNLNSHHFLRFWFTNEWIFNNLWLFLYYNPQFIHNSLAIWSIACDSLVTLVTTGKNVTFFNFSKVIEVRFPQYWDFLIPNPIWGIYKNAKHILDFFIPIVWSLISWPAQEISCSQQQSNQSWPKLVIFSKKCLFQQLKYFALTSRLVDYQRVRLFTCDSKIVAKGMPCIFQDKCNFWSLKNTLFIKKFI
jgi:hypothetical protein